MRYNLLLACLVAMLVFFVGVDSAYAQTPAVNVTSTTANDTYTEDTIDIRLVSPESFLFEGFSIVDNTHGFGVLDNPRSVTTTTIGTKHYALVASNGDSGVQIIDITNPASPVATANITDDSDGFGVLEGAYSVTATKIGTKHYALITSNTVSGGVQIIDITNPASPVATANITDDSDGFGVLEGAYSVTTTKIGSNHYALVASNGDNGVQIIDITNPASPVATANITDDSDGFGVLDNPRSVTTTTIGTKHYALVASNGDSGVQIIDITNPASPVATANITDDSDGFGVLEGAYSVTATKIGTKHYALITSNTVSGGVQIIDITNPASPVSTANITGESSGFDAFSQPTSVTTTTIGTKHYALVAVDFSDSLQIIDITNPASPVTTVRLMDNSGGFDVLGGAYSVTTTKIGTKHYALVASYYSNQGVQIIDITDPTKPFNPLWPFIALDTDPPARAFYKEADGNDLIFEYDVGKYDYSPRLGCVLETYTLIL